MRQLLAHVVQKVNPRLSLINHAETISAHVIEHIDEVPSSGGKLKRTLGRADATDLLGEGTYIRDDERLSHSRFSVTRQTYRNSGSTINVR